MTAIEINDLTTLQGKTFRQVFMWEEKPIIMNPIASISLASGAPVAVDWENKAKTEYMEAEADPTAAFSVRGREGNITRST